MSKKNTDTEVRPSEEIRKELTQLDDDIAASAKSLRAKKSRKKKLETVELPEAIAREKQKALEHRKFVLGGKMMLLIPELRDTEYVDDYVKIFRLPVDNEGNRKPFPVLILDADALEKIKADTAIQKEHARKVAEAKAAKEAEARQIYAENEKKEEAAKQAGMAETGRS